MKSQDLLAIKEQIQKDILSPADKTRVLIGLATCGIASGAAPVPFFYLLQKLPSIPPLLFFLTPKIT